MLVELICKKDIHKFGDVIKLFVVAVLYKIRLYKKAKILFYK